MEREDYIKKIAGGERRFFSDVPELRAADVAGTDSRKVKGLGIVYNKLSQNFCPWMEGGMYEVIEPGAAEGLLDNEEIMILFNHDTNLVLARNKNTATLTATNEGVVYEYETPNTSVGNDLLENVKLKNIRKSSFAFTVKESKNEIIDWPGLGSINLRRILRFNELFDFSPVTYPGYMDTDVMARSFKTEIEQKEKEAKAYLIDVMKRKHELFKLK
jgi:HK97 family phage prohead protease